MHPADLAKEIYKYCVKEKMSCEEFGRLVSFLNIYKESAYSRVRRQMDKLQLPSRD